MTPLRTSRTAPRHRPAGRGLAAVAALLASLSALAPSSAGAQPPPAGAPVVLVPASGSTAAVLRTGLPTREVAAFPSTQSFTGHFDGDGVEDVFLYTPGPGRDAVLDVALDGSSTLRDAPVGGRYQPIVGRFSVPDGTDDILWYAPGPAPDHLWSFHDDGTYRTRRLDVGGTYQPVVGELTDFAGGSPDSILWYGQGSAPDHLWSFDFGGHPRSQRLQVGGTYNPVVGRFLRPAAGRTAEQVVWWSPDGADHLWRFDGRGTPTSRPLPALGAADNALVGRFSRLDQGDGIVFYRVGPGSERRVGFDDRGTLVDHRVAPVTGTYGAIVADTDGNGWDDIVWSAAGAGTIWRYPGAELDQLRFRTSVGLSWPHGLQVEPAAWHAAP